MQLACSPSYMLTVIGCFQFSTLTLTNGVRNLAAHACVVLHTRLLHGLTQATGYRLLQATGFYTVTQAAQHWIMKVLGIGYTGLYWAPRRQVASS